MRKLLKFFDDTRNGSMKFGSEILSASTARFLQLGDAMGVDLYANNTTMAESMAVSNGSIDVISDIFANGDTTSIPGSGEMAWYGYMICIISMLLIWVFGSGGNFLVIFVVCKDKQLQTPMNMFLVNLSLADFITSAFGSPFPLVASIMHEWPFGDTMCIIYAFGMSLGGITSITTLMVLAFERYLMIARPFRAADIKMHHSTVIILGIWFYSLALTLPPLFGWSSYGPEGPYISCSVSWEKDDLTTKTYICFLFVLGLVLPLVTIVFSYVGIVSTIKSTTQTQVTTRSATARAELRVTAMVAVMIACFLIAWSPYAVVSLIVAFGGRKGRKLITPVVSVLPAIFAKSATCYNPIIYVGLNTQNAWFKLFGIQREGDENQTRVTGSVVVGNTTGVPNISNTVTMPHKKQSPLCSKNSSSQNSPTFPHDQKAPMLQSPAVIHAIPSHETDCEKKLNKADIPSMSATTAATTNITATTTNTTLELVPLTSREPQEDLEEQTQENNDIHSST